MEPYMSSQGMQSLPDRRRIRMKETIPASSATARRKKSFIGYLSCPNDSPPAAPFPAGPAEQ